MSTVVRYMIGLVMLFCIGAAIPVSAELKDDQHQRFYARYVGKWRANVAKSVYLVGKPPQEAPSHTYSAVPGKKGIKYNDEIVHILDGRDNPLSTRQPGSTVAREVLDEFTVANTIKRDGQVASRNTFVLSPDGKAAVMTFIDFNERGESVVARIVYYEKVG